ncbi:MAG TPA: ZIP family metal transporter [Candidatus Saccharimonadia bacterium]
MDLAYSLIAAISISILALIGLFFAPKNWTHKREIKLLGFAAGVLLATATLELLPEAVEHSQGKWAYYSILAGIVGFFFLERIFRSFHTHRKDQHLKAAGSLVIIGDGVHNFIDGMAIAVAFQVSPMVGVITTLAIAAHELPQEIADYIVLIRSGYSRKRALLLNFASGLTAITGVLLVFALGGIIESIEGPLLGITVGFFLYIASADIIPELNHKHEAGEKFLLAFILGIALIAGLVLAIPHE